MKNFSNAIMLDAEDDYDHKELSLAGLAATIEQIRVGIAAACRMPISKLFGLSASGFNSGEDDIENYNTIVEHERERARDVLDRVLPLVCRHLFGYEPQLEYEFKPLRVLSGVDQENVLNSKFNRLSMLYSQGFFTDEEYARALKEDKIVLMDTEVSRGERAIEVPMTPPSTFETAQPIPKLPKVAETKM
jgi:phage-related protein (TIGR01555 family)